MLIRHQDTRIPSTESTSRRIASGLLAATATVTRLGTLLVTLGITALTTVLTGGPASAASIRIPDHATLVISGHGYGHGHGLSQYGARGAARKGLTAQQIVHFYYPHTRGGHLGGSVKVLLTADTDSRTTVVNRAGLAVHDLGSGGTTRRLPTSGAAGKASQWRLSPGRHGRTRVSYRHAGWHLWRTLGGDGEFRSARPITLVLGSARVTYRGSLQSRTPPPHTSTLSRVTVNKVPLEAYVRGVVPQEMPALWEQAALRAQAIAARTYAAFEARSSTNSRWNLCDSSACQVYGGKSAEFPTSNEAVAKTRGQVRMFHRAPAFTQFSSSNGGWESDGGKPYLPAQKDPYEKLSGNPYHTWTAKIPAHAVERVFPQLGHLQSITIERRDGHGQWRGRVLSMSLHGSQGDVSHLSGDTFRSVLGLRSTWFTIGVA